MIRQQEKKVIETLLPDCVAQAGNRLCEQSDEMKLYSFAEIYLSRLLRGDSLALSESDTRHSHQTSKTCPTLREQPFLFLPDLIIQLNYPA